MIAGARKSGLHHVKKSFVKTHDPLWQMHLGVISIIILQLFTDHAFLPFNKFWLIGIEVLLLVILIVATTEGYNTPSKGRRKLAIILISLIAIINTLSLVLLTSALLNDGSLSEGRALLGNGLAIYVTNILMFALLYWELDGQGPDRRTAGQTRRDFLFPQMDDRSYRDESWLPGYIDYLYLSATNVTNFASADVRPLSHRAKLLMMCQALISVVVVLLVLARAVSVLQ